MLNNKKTQLGEIKSQLRCEVLTMKKDKRGQLGETLTWIVATIIIIFVLVAFVFAASLMGKAKAVSPKKVELKKGETVLSINWIEVKTIFAFEKNIENKNKIDSWIKEVEIKNDEK